MEHSCAGQRPAASWTDLLRGPQGLRLQGCEAAGERAAAVHCVGGGGALAEVLATCGAELGVELMAERERDAKALSLVLWPSHTFDRWRRS